MDSMERESEDCREREELGVVIGFYTLAQFRRAAKGIRARAAVKALGTMVCFRPNALVHVNVVADGWIWEPTFWHYLILDSRYPVRPMVEAHGGASLRLCPETWLATRFTRLTSILDWIGLPAPGEVHSCARDCGRLVGIGGCPRPTSLLRMLEAQDGWHIRRRGHCADRADASSSRGGRSAADRRGPEAEA